MIPQQTFDAEKNTDPLTGRWTPGMESNKTYGQQDVKPEPEPEPYPTFHGWMYEG